jgi:hypothetical protein
MICEEPDFIFPLQADVFYPTVEQGAYGNVKKQWMHDKTIVCSFASPGGAAQEDIKPNVNITQTLILSGRVKSDLRISTRDAKTSLTNIVISNIRDRNCENIYLETAGIRAGKSTIFEIASQEPIVGPFGGVEYYKVVLRRSENQGVDL